MYKWLKDEMARVNTNKFYVVDGPLPCETRRLVEQSELSVPKSYKQFVVQFGNARLYRLGSMYMVQVFAIPNGARSDDGSDLLHFGRTDLALAYFKSSSLVPGGGESPVFEWRHGQGLRQASDGFEGWLMSRCAASRKFFTKKQWRLIEHGPSPFTEQELRIIHARRQFRWRPVGIAANGDIQFSVHNGSVMVLPFLSVGVRGTNGHVNGGVWLPVSSVKPGQTTIIEVDCYKDLLPSDQVEVFEFPDPEPEDRDRFWEFRSVK